MEKVVLAYSGGLDTSCILRWLMDKGYEVIAYIADLGQGDDLDEAKKRGEQIGAKKIYIEDAKEEFITDFVFPAIRANAIYEGRYLLGTSLARPLIAKKQIEIAKKEKAHYVSHGATGKGNDQVRFELTYSVLNPSIKIIAPWKDPEFLKQFQGRNDLIDYAQKKRLPIKQTKKEPWSSDANLMHISYEAGELEDPLLRPREAMFQMTKSAKDAPEKETIVKIDFEKGNPIKVTNLNENTTNKEGAKEGTVGTVKTKPLELFKYLNKIGGENGIGREDIVENRFVGMKSRGVYETPAGTILIKAHRDMEGLTMDREVMHLRDSLIPRFAEMIYYGFWYSPEMEFLRAAFDKSQEYVTGSVYVALYKGNVTIIGRESPYSLYNQQIASMDIAGGYNPQDAVGFIRLNALRLKASALRKNKF